MIQFAEIYLPNKRSSNKNCFFLNRLSPNTFRQNYHPIECPSAWRDMLNKDNVIDKSRQIVPVLVIEGH